MLTEVAVAEAAVLLAVFNDGSVVVAKDRYGTMMNHELPLNMGARPIAQTVLTKLQGEDRVLCVVAGVNYDGGEPGAHPVDECSEEQRFRVRLVTKRPESSVDYAELNLEIGRAELPRYPLGGEVWVAVSPLAQVPAHVKLYREFVEACDAHGGSFHDLPAELGQKAFLVLDAMRADTDPEYRSVVK